MDYSIPKYYANVNLEADPEYVNYNTLRVNWNSLDNYELARKLGRGKYSEVFEGVNVTTGQNCVIKILKPVKKRKIFREIKLLMNV